MSKFYYDALGRQRFQVGNWNNFSWSGGSPSGIGDGSAKDKDNMTGWEYDGLVKLIAYDEDANGTAGDDEITEYRYEDDSNASLATKIIYPDGDTSSDNVQLQYDLDGRLNQRTDQRGVVMQFTYNDRRQLVAQKATTIPGTVDGTIQRIERGYDDLARLWVK